MNDQFRDWFEASYAQNDPMKMLRVKFERAATGGYRDPAINAAWKQALRQSEYGRAA